MKFVKVDEFPAIVEPNTVYFKKDAQGKISIGLSDSAGVELSVFEASGSVSPDAARLANSYDIDTLITASGRYVVYMPTNGPVGEIARDFVIENIKVETNEDILQRVSMMFGSEEYPHGGIWYRFYSLTNEAWGNWTRLADTDSVDSAVSGKVDAVAGYGLSEENFSLAEKNKLAALESSHYKGLFTTLAALQAAITSPVAGDYADIDSGVGSDATRYHWDSSDSVWVKTGPATTLTSTQVKTLYEANDDTNVYTDAEKTKLAGIAANANNYSLPLAQSTVLGGVKMRVSGGTLYITNDGSDA